MNVFLKGTCLLVIAAFIGECIEFFINMILARELGEEGMGLYMTILPSIFLVMILASLELPVSISKYVAEKDPKYHHSMLTHATRFTIIFVILLVSLAMIVLPFIPVFNDYHPHIRWLVIIAIPIVSFSSISRGYFMGIQAMGKIALANLLRKVMQLILLLFIYQLFQFGKETSLFLALSTIVVSDLVVLGYLSHEYIIQRQSLLKFQKSSISAESVRKNLLAVSLPTTGLRIFSAVTNAIEPFLIKTALLNSGLTATMATEHFGIMAGVAITIGFFPAFIAHSLLIVLIPTVSEAYANKDIDKLHLLLKKVIRFTFLYSLPTIFIIYLFAEPLTQLFFDSKAAAVYLQMLSLYFLCYFFVIPMQAYLIGLGLVKDALIHSIWSTIVSFGLMYYLGSIPSLQMEGVIIGMNTGVVLLTFMHYLTICKKLDQPIILRGPVQTFPN